MIRITDETKSLIDNEVVKFPNLHKYLVHFIETNGNCENPEWLPYLIVWIRYATDDCPCSSDGKLFKMDDETYCDFCSWGHNSRWKNVFWDYLVENIDNCVKDCLELAKTKGDIDVVKKVIESEDE